MRKEYELDIDKKSQWKIFTSHSISNVLPFRIEECGIFYAKSEFYTEGEEINNYLLLYTISGEGYCNYRNNKQILRPNSVVLINCMEPFYVRTLEKGWCYFWMHFNGAMVEKYMESMMEEQADIIMVNDDQMIVKNFEELLNYPVLLDRNLSYYVSNNISNILTGALLNKEISEKVASTSRYSNTIVAVTEYIEQHYKEEITIDDLLEVVHLSKYYFIKTFKKIMGTTPYDYLLNYRISKSKIILRTTEQSISEVAETVGFSSLNNFIIQFKRNVGTTPGLYRRTQVSINRDSLIE